MRTTKITIAALFVVLTMCIAPAIADAAISKFAPPVSAIDVWPSKRKNTPPKPNFSQMADVMTAHIGLSQSEYEDIEDGNIVWWLEGSPTTIIRFTYAGTNIAWPVRHMGGVAPY